MPQDLPVVCSLETGELQRRLDAIAQTGAASLIDRAAKGGGHLLRFRSDARTRRRLEGIVAAEARCCPFLDLSLDDDGEDLILSIAAPRSGQATADALADAFEGAQPR
jgi:hypothetical protein